MGRLKQVLPFNDTCMAGQVIRTALAASLDPVILVTGCQAEQVALKVNPESIRIVENRDWVQGMSTSIRCGLKALSDTCRAAVFLLADQPLVTTDIITRLVKSHIRSCPPITLPVCDGVRGNPVIIDRQLFAELETLTGDTGARVLFDRYQNRMCKVEVNDPAVLMDADTPEAYDRMLKQAAINSASYMKAQLLTS